MSKICLTNQQNITTEVMLIDFIHRLLEWKVEDAVRMYYEELEGHLDDEIWKLAPQEELLEVLKGWNVEFIGPRVKAAKLQYNACCTMYQHIHHSNLFSISNK